MDNLINPNLILMYVTDVWDIPNYITLIAEIVIGIIITLLVRKEGKSIRSIWKQNRSDSLHSLFSMINGSFGMVESTLESLNIKLESIPTSIHDYSRHIELIKSSRDICMDMLNDVENKIKFQSKELDYKTLNSFRNISRMCLHFHEILLRDNLKQSDLSQLYISYDESRKLFLKLKGDFPDSWQKIVDDHSN